MAQESPEIIIVGAGISGATLAHQYATQQGKRVLIIEKRNHIGGNCYDRLDDAGVRISQYGAHIFHTRWPEVQAYVSQFTKWRPYQHRVLSRVGDQLVPVPVNRTTVNQLFGLDLQSDDAMNAWLKTQIASIQQPQNSEDSALSRVGPELYELLFKPYTRKQWSLWPHELGASVLDRIPVRVDTNDRYFSDPFEAIPQDGYTAMFERMLEHPLIEVRLNTDWFAVHAQLPKPEKIFFTGPIDAFLRHKYGRLQYRSLRFEFETLNQEWYQPVGVVNYPSLDVPWTRIVEYKHLSGQQLPVTTISREYPTWEGEPYYPVPNDRNRTLYQRYQREAEELERTGVYMVGRLANYKYFNMDEAFKNALELYERLAN